MNISQGPHYVDDTITVTATTHDVATGALTDADAVPAYRVYEDETGTAILTGNMAKLDDASTTGFYSEQLTLSAANGFEVGKSYTVYVTAAVDSVTGGTSGSFKVIAPLATAAAIAALNNLSAAQVNAEADTALADAGVTTTRTGYLDNLSGGAVALASSLATLAGKFTGITLLAEWLGLIAGKQSGNATARTELRATGAGAGTFDETTDSQEAVRDRGDAAWVTATGFSTHSAAGAAAAVRTELTTELGRLDAAVSTRATPAQVNQEADTAIADAGLATATNLGLAKTAIDAIKVITDALTAAAAAKLAASALGIITGTVDSTVAPTTTEFECDDITEATADHYVGRIVTFTSGVLLGQSTDITDYSLVGGKGHFVVTALTDAPGNNDSLVIT